MLLNRVILRVFLLVGVSFGQGYGSIEGTLTDEGGMAISGDCLCHAHWTAHGVSYTDCGDGC